MIKTIPLSGSDYKYHSRRRHMEWPHDHPS